MFAKKIFGINFGVTFSFFAVAALIFLSPETVVGEFFKALGCCFLHETGHLFFMLLFDKKPEEVTLYGGGIKIVPQSGISCFMWQEILILLGGCIFNFIAAVICYFVEFDCFFVCMNFFLAAFNLMPFAYFDGGRVLELILGEKIILVIIQKLILVMEILAGVFMTINGRISISFLAVMLFVIFSDVICDICKKYHKSRL